MSGQQGDIYNLLALAAYRPEREPHASAREDGPNDALPRLRINRGVQRWIGERLGGAVRRRGRAASA